jgi:hypothetical protein
MWKKLHWLAKAGQLTTHCEIATNNAIAPTAAGPSHFFFARRVTMSIA